MISETIKKSIYLVILLNYLNLDFCLATEHSYSKDRGTCQSNQDPDGCWGYGEYAQSSNHAHGYYAPSNHANRYWGYSTYSHTSFFIHGYSHSSYYGNNDEKASAEAPSYAECPMEDLSKYQEDSFWENTEFSETEEEQFQECPDSCKSDEMPVEYIDSMEVDENQIIIDGISIGTGKWEPEEDELLAQRARFHLIHCGEVKWSQIQKRYFPNRTSKSLRERWNEHLDPNLDLSQLSEEDKKFILDFASKKGNKWVDLSKCMPCKSGKHRPPNMLKNYWNSVTKKAMRKASKTQVDSK